MLPVLCQAIFTAGYKAVLHVHSVVEECEIVDLIEEIDMKKKKDADQKKRKPKRKPLFVKNGAVVVCRIQVFSKKSPQPFLAIIDNAMLL
jgi:peptide chain release factor subunit 3